MTYNHPLSSFDMGSGATARGCVFLTKHTIYQHKIQEVAYLVIIYNQLALSVGVFLNLPFLNLKFINLILASGRVVRLSKKSRQGISGMAFFEIAFCYNILRRLK